MSHSYHKIWLHVIFSTKDRLPIISSAIEKEIYAHIELQLTEMECVVQAINGMPDHIHLLFRQNPKLAIADIIKQLKGNTSHWINNENIIRDKFGWQTGYAVYSVSESQLEKVTRYIVNQKEHHLKKAFQSEYDEFIQVHGLTNDQA